jgi:hypothetical protein
LKISAQNIFWRIFQDARFQKIWIGFAQPEQMLTSQLKSGIWQKMFKGLAASAVYHW